MTQTPPQAPPHHPLRVLCVDDNPMVTRALERRFGRETDLEWVGGINDGGDLVSRILAARPQVVLMDVDMPGTDAFATVERLDSSDPAVRVIMLSDHINLGYVDRAMDAGAWGYLSKHEDVSALLAAIWRVARGEVAFSAEVEAARRGAAKVHPSDP